MPEIFDESKVSLGQRPQDAELNKAMKPEPSFMDTLGAAFEADNTVGSLIAHGIDGDPRVDLNFDPIQEAEDRGIDSELWDRFTYAADKQAFQRIQDRIANEQANRQTIADAGGKGIAASIIAGTLDPINLIPIGGTAVRIGKTGKSIYQGVKGTAITASTSIAAQEAILQGTQETRSIEESAVNIAGGTFLAGILGGSVAAISNVVGGRTLKQLGKGVEKDFANPSVVVPESTSEQVSAAMNVINDSVGAARTPEMTLEQQQLVTNKSFKAIEKTFGQLSPAVRLAGNTIKEINEFAEKLVDLPLMRNKNLEGIANQQSVEIAVRGHQAQLADAIAQGRTEFKAYKGSIKGKDVEKLSERQFMEEVGRAMIRGDAHPNEHVARAAKGYRKLYDMEAQEAIKLKLLPEDVQPETATSYLNRVYNIRKITQQEGRFRETVRNWANNAYDEAVAANETILKMADPKSKAYQDAFEKLQTRLSPQERQSYIEDVTTNVIRSIKGRDQLTGFSDIKPITRGPLKERTFNIRDELIEDFLEKDIEVLSHRFSRVISGEIELTRKFGTARFDDIVKQLENVQTDKAKEIIDSQKAALKGVTDPNAIAEINRTHEKMLDDLNKEYEKGVTDLEAMWDMVRGTYRASNARPDDLLKRSLSAVRTFNYIRQLGGVTVSSFPDIAMPVFVHGFNRTFGDAVSPLVRGLASPEAKLANKLTKETARRAAIAVESELNARSMALYQISDPYAQGTQMERFLQGLGRNFGRITGLNFWNNSMKNISAMISQQRMVDALFAGDKIAKSDDLWLNQLGIGKTAREGIRRQIEKYGKDIDGRKIVGDDKWDNEELVRKFRNALLADVDRTIVTKGIGDVPIALESDIGKTIAQFQSFSLAGNQRVLMSGLQRGDREALEGMIGLIGMGMMVYYLKTIERGAEPSDNPMVWIKEGVDRSGLASMPMWANKTFFEPAGIGMDNALGKKSSFLDPEKGLQSLLGPSTGLVIDTLKTTHGLASMVSKGEVAPADIDAARRLVPYNNLVGVRYLFDAAEEGLKQSIGKKTQKRKVK